MQHQIFILDQRTKHFQKFFNIFQNSETEDIYLLLNTTKIKLLVTLYCLS